MRRGILLVFILILIVGGLLQNIKVRSHISNAPISEENLNRIRCIQFLLAFSIYFPSGLFFFFFPRKTVEWLIEPLSPRWKNFIQIGKNYWGLQFFGLVLLLASVLGIPGSSCF
jgi:hypothetical protein